MSKKDIFERVNSDKEKKGVKHTQSSSDQSMVLPLLIGGGALMYAVSTRKEGGEDSPLLPSPPVINPTPPVVQPETTPPVVRPPEPEIPPNISKPEKPKTLEEEVLERFNLRPGTVPCGRVNNRPGHAAERWYETESYGTFVSDDQIHQERGDHYTFGINIFKGQFRLFDGTTNDPLNRWAVQNNWYVRVHKEFVYAKLFVGFDGSPEHLRREYGVGNRGMFAKIKAWKKTVWGDRWFGFFDEKDALIASSKDYGEGYSQSKREVISPFLPESVLLTSNNFSNSPTSKDVGLIFTRGTGLILDTYLSDIEGYGEYRDQMVLPLDSVSAEEVIVGGRKAVYIKGNSFVVAAVIMKNARRKEIFC